MKKILLYIILILIIPNTILAGNLITNFSRIHAIDSQPYKIGKWIDIPQIVVCSTAPITLEGVKAAIDWWTKRGHKLNKNIIFKNKEADIICNEATPIGYITIDIGDENTLQKDTSLGTSYVSVLDPIGEIVWTRIYLKFTPNPMVLEHELGHGLGFLHYNKVGHLMHEKWAESGWSDIGLNLK